MKFQEFNLVINLVNFPPKWEFRLKNESFKISRNCAFIGNIENAVFHFFLVSTVLDAGENFGKISKSSFFVSSEEKISYSTKISKIFFQTQILQIENLIILEIGISVRNGWIPARYPHPRWVAETHAGLCRDSPQTTTRRSHQSCSRIFQQFKSTVFTQFFRESKRKFRPSVMLNLESQMNRKVKTVKLNSQLLLIRHKMMTKR